LAFDYIAASDDEKCDKLIGRIKINYIATAHCKFFMQYAVIYIVKLYQSNCPFSTAIILVSDSLTNFLDVLYIQ